MTLFTIGFTETSAAVFFGKLKRHRVRRLVDSRLFRNGQLSGFAKARDLPYFLSTLVSMEYDAMPSLAPTPKLLKAFRNATISWTEYAAAYDALLSQRRPETLVDPSFFEDACLLCSEQSPDRCHRRLAAVYLQNACRHKLEIVHL